jgi:hypothetical protein
VDGGRFGRQSRPVIRSTRSSRAYHAIAKRAKRQPYSRERRAEALALARIAGAEIASERTRIPVQTIRRWMDAAGVQPGADLPQERLEALRDLAEASVVRDLVEGRIRGVQAMTVAGIARRHIAKAEAATTDGSGSAVAAKETFFDWLELLAAESIESEEDIEPTIAAIGDVVTALLLARANAEADPYATAPTGHRAAILSWFSGRPEIEAGDILEWSKTQVLEVIAQHGSLVAWHAFQQAEDAAEKARREAEYAVIEARAAALRAEAEGAIHDAEARARLAAVELSRRPRI